MAHKNGQVHNASAGVVFPWEQPAASMRRTPAARSIEVAGSFRDGQALAGSGALVFEGELLEGPRFRLH
ncbi:MAG: hypothetical protein MUE79_09035 [Nitratireductor sp.]|jgi:hypothetical protein|nr:hypothetical protein [Nitratireductor sp.]